VGIERATHINLVAACTLALLLALVATAAPTALRGTVASVYDGDTITVTLESGAAENVRLIGIDAPEVRTNRHGRADKVRGPAARDHLRELVADKPVFLILGEKERDRYGRALAYVYCNGLFINAEMIRAGHAVTYTVPPDVAHKAEFLAAEREAQGRGAREQKAKKNKRHRTPTRPPNTNP